MAIAGSEDGYLLAGTIYEKPAPRAAIWSSPDGLTWTLAQGDEIFDVGAYIDTMETPAAGGIAGIALAPSGSGGPWRAIAVGSTCPKGEPGAGPKGEASPRTYEWTTGQCRAQAWRSADGLTWERLDLPNGYFGAGSVATDGSDAIVGVTGAEDRKEVIASANGIDWSAFEGEVGRQVALAADSSGFHALVPRCLNEGCRRRSLDLWSSVDGVTWRLDQAQPTMPQGVEDFLDVDVADFGRPRRRDRRLLDRAAHGHCRRWRFSAHRWRRLRTAESLGPPRRWHRTPLSGGADRGGACDRGGHGRDPAACGRRSAADTVLTPAGRLAYVTGLDEGTARIRILETDTGTDALLAKGSEPTGRPTG